MFTLNPCAAPFTPSSSSPVSIPIFNEGHLSAYRIVDSEEYRSEVWKPFDRDQVADEDLFNPAVYPVSEKDHEELAATEAFNRQMAELEDLEHQEELRSLLADRIRAIHNGMKQRPAKITSLPGNIFLSGYARGIAPLTSKGKNFKPPVKKCHHINQPPAGRN